MLSVVIVNWNSGSCLEHCVASLRREAAHADIIIVDNASHDGSLGFAMDSRIEAEVIRNRENIGFAAACNQGWRKAAGDLILFLNPDTEATAHGVSRLEMLMAEDPEIWAAGGKLVSPERRHQSGFNVRAFPTLGSLAAEMFLLDEFLPKNPWSRRHRMSDWDHDSRRDVDQPAAACLAVRRWVLDKVRGFDESFVPAWFEDVDLCRRIRNAGGRIVFEPGALFLHHGGVSLKHLSYGEFLRHYHTNQIRYFRKHHGAGVSRRARRLVVSGMWVRALASYLRPVAPAMTRRASARVFRQTARILAGDRSSD